MEKGGRSPMENEEPLMADRQMSKDLDKAYEELSKIAKGNEEVLTKLMTAWLKTYLEGKML